MQQARAWIDDCLQNHPECKQGEPCPQFPRRLIRISSRTDSLELSASLCDGISLPPTTSYTTLSHRWGRQSLFKLTTKNLNRLRLDIPVGELSRSFQDAIFLTHHLGVEYLWIDSLCIVQDDMDDWERECKTMCGIYKGTLCKIAASSPGGDEERGFLLERRQKQPIIPPLVHIDWHASPIIPYSRGGIPGRDYIISDAAIIDDLRNDELYSRAWLLQEQLLVRTQPTWFTGLPDSQLILRAGSKNPSLPERPNILGMQNGYAE